VSVAGEPSRSQARRPLLDVSGVAATYQNAIVALSHVSLAVGEGEIVALLGANGAGKTTTLRAISQLLAAQRGQVTHGSIAFAGTSTLGLAPADVVALGLAQVLENRRCFPNLTVEENLIVGGLGGGRRRRSIGAGLQRVYGYFPRLAQKRRIPAGLCSGGEQQMAAIGRALMANPRLLLLDEPTIGLAPLVANELFVFLRTLKRDEGVTVLVAEQNATLALRYADRAYVLEHGTIVLEGSAAELRERDDIKHFYLGLETAHRDQLAAPRAYRASASMDTLTCNQP
jgi:branched-chain amino acid transport system ATP-binding protein